jgi:4-amino-4-deoxy-L-arabinose transferase-like glycosyltransferase
MRPQPSGQRAWKRARRHHTTSGARRWAKIDAVQPPPARSAFRTPDPLALALTFVVAFGAWLRFSALGNGLPFSPQVDEPQIVDRALRMMQTGIYNPAPFFDYPGLYIYVQLATAVVSFIVGAMNGVWSSLDQTQSPSFYWGFYTWGRAVTASFGTATVVLTYAVARRIGRLAGVVAALLIATQPMHVRESHYILTDVPMTFFVTLTMLLAVRACERDTPRDYCWAGIAAGLAAATKYNGGVAIVMPLAGLLLSGNRKHLGTSALAILGGAALGFVVAAPYTILDLPAFLNAFGYLVHQYARPADSARLTYFKHLRINLGTPGLILATLGFGFAAVRLWRAARPERVAWGAAAVFAIAWFVMVSEQAIVFGRYLLPLLPAVCIIMGGAVAGIAEMLPRARWRPVVRGALLAGLVGIVVAAPTAASVNFVSAISKTWTTALAHRWIFEHIPPDSRVVVETRMLLLPSDRYRSTNERRLADRAYDDYVRDKVQFLVASSESFGDLESPGAVVYRTLFRPMELVFSVAPSDEHPGPQIRIYRLHP